jgi:hypothetical protein
MDATKLTGLWKNKDKKGNTFLSGTLNAITNLLIMPNTFKKEGDDKAPDYYVYIAPKDKDAKPKKEAMPLESEL